MLQASPERPEYLYKQMVIIITTQLILTLQNSTRDIRIVALHRCNVPKGGMHTIKSTLLFAQSFDTSKARVTIA